MKAYKTTICNKEFTRPESMPECNSLWVYEWPRNDTDQPMLSSWWKLSFVERIQILFGRNIRLTVVGTGHPPVTLEVDPNNFGDHAKPF